MPLPAMFGLAALGQYLAGLLTALASLWMAYVSVRLVIRLFVVGIVVSMGFDLYETVESLLDSASVAVPSIVSTAGTWILPSNTSTCVSILVSVFVATLTYKYSIRLIKWATRDIL